MPTYQIVFSPTLNVSAAEFSAAWNEGADSRRAAEASLVAEPAVSFPLDPELVRLGVVALVTAVGTAAAQGALEGIKELVKAQTMRLLQKPFAGGASPSEAPPITVETVRQPDGSVLLVVKEAEEAAE